MKQGTTKKPLPKDKHTKASWKKRDEARKVKQADHAANLLLAATDADETEAERITRNIAESDEAEARVDAEVLAEGLALQAARDADLLDHVQGENS